MRNQFLTILIIGFIGALIIFLESGQLAFNQSLGQSAPQESPVKENEITEEQNTPIPDQKVLENKYHIYQSFNNCGPASLSMTLSYYNIQISQDELGRELRPYQNPQGDNDDKSVTLEEMGVKAKDYDLVPYHRPHGDITLLKKFIANDIPVITRTWLETNDDIGHYRVVKGYDDRTKEIIQDDSYQGPNLRYSYEEFNELWSKFNYEYLVLVPSEKQDITERILGDEADKKIAWMHAKENALQELEVDPENVTSRFNLSVAYYHLGQYEDAIREYEAVASRLPFRTLWYQIEPLQAYYEVGNYEKVFEITDNILNNQNRAYSEAYIIRGDSYNKQGETESARQEYVKAVYYKNNSDAARQRLESL